MEKKELLKSLGFSDDFLGLLEKSQNNMPNFINNDSSSGYYQVKTYDSDNVIVSYNSTGFQNSSNPKQK